VPLKQTAAFSLTHPNSIFRFKFTRLSAVEPNKVFSFILTNQTDGTYILSKCEPELNKDKTDVLVQVLNSDSDNGLMHFMAGMSECIYD
jgi:hypothetical protein